MKRTRDLASLGGNLAVTQSMHLGTKKKLEYNKFYILILLFLSSCSYAFLYDLTCLSIIIALQASNEAYRNIKCPYKRMSPRQNENSIFSGDIRTIHTNTNLFYNSFYPSTIRKWNNLAQEIKDASSVASFKYQLNRETRNRAPPKYYLAGSRKGQILHARLRMQCSSLNADLYRKNIIPSPSCSCGGFESAYHFFYICPQLTAVREMYLGDVLRSTLCKIR